MTEFDLIRRYFTRPSSSAEVGVGDDAAVLKAGNGNVLAVSTDMLVSGTHFFPDTDPFSLGHKTLAVNLSDMAAMGALPRWALLSLSLPEADEAWLERFSAGFFALAAQHGVELVGGDTTRGPLNLCVTIIGEVPQGQVLLRSGAREGDEIWVSGTLGDAALALTHLQGRVQLGGEALDFCTTRLHKPEPRVALGLALRGIASSAIDVSDGLLADLGHIVKASRVGARIDISSIPLSAVLQLRAGGDEITRQCILSGGDDYELCFTASTAHHGEIVRISSRLGLQLTCMGRIVAGEGCVDENGNRLDTGTGGYDHFR